MKQLFLFFILILAACSKHDLDAVRKTGKAHRSSPPGTVWLRDSLYMDQCEVRNLDYLEYISWLKANDPQNYEKALPDTTVWRQPMSYNEPYVKYYFQHPAYRNYPVVGVSHEQAEAYCEWRTARVLEFDKSRKNPLYSKGLRYRLPTKEEWEYGALAGTMELYGFHSMQNHDNCPNFNVKELWMMGYRVSADVTNTVLWAKPNRYGLYGMIGNVAEMISEKGVAKGGGWIHSIADCEISDSTVYAEPKAWLGFRCVAAVKE
jgi:formylglycine-generating enzyme required for sulfatase activity